MHLLEQFIRKVQRGVRVRDHQFPSAEAVKRLEWWVGRRASRGQMGEG